MRTRQELETVNVADMTQEEAAECIKWAMERMRRELVNSEQVILGCLTRFEAEPANDATWDAPAERAAFDALIDAIANAYDTTDDKEQIETEVAIAALRLRDEARKFAAPRRPRSPNDDATGGRDA